MPSGWIDAKQFPFDTLLLMDRWIFRTIARKEDPEFRQKLAISLSGNPKVHWYIVNKCPERKEYYDELVASVTAGCSIEEMRDSENFVLDALDWAVVYVYPEIMEKLPYIKDWNNDRLLSITDFSDKTVMDIGSGTGRLAFAAATVARHVYACEPVDRLREYMREKQKRLNVNNLYVTDGSIELLPFHDEFFDIVVSGHVLGDDFKVELREMSRVTRPGGYIIDCPGEDDRKIPEDPARELIEYGFQYSHYVSRNGGDVYRHWWQKPL